jgi:hypothetical protein
VQNYEERRGVGLAFNTPFSVTGQSVSFFELARGVTAVETLLRNRVKMRADSMVVQLR